MPNHCECELWVTGPKDEVAKFIEGVKATSKPKKDYEGKDIENEFRISIMDAFLPMPEEIRKSQSGSTIIDGERIDAWLEEPDGTKTILTKEMQDELFEKHGAVNWYDWAQLHWGTKWGDYDTVIEREEGKSGAKLSFTSAWGPPCVGMQHISHKMPSLRFRLKYWERGMGFQGTWECEAGDVLMDVGSDYHGERGG